MATQPQLTPPGGSPSFAERMIWLFARFDGRIGRQAYWLANVQIVLALLVFLRPMLTVHIDPATETIVVGKLPVPAMVIVLLTTVSTLAIGVKRLHDFGASGFFSATLLVPPLNILATLVIGLIPGTAGSNRFGPGPDRMPRQASGRSGKT